MKKTPKCLPCLQRRFFCSMPIFYGLKNIDFCCCDNTKTRNKVDLKSRVLNYAENIERGPKSLVFLDFPEKMQKSGFPTKRSHFRK